MAWDLFVFALDLQGVAIGVADTRAFNLNKEFVWAGLFDLHIIADLEDAVRAWFIDPSCNLRRRDCIGGHVATMKRRGLGMAIRPRFSFDRNSSLGGEDVGKAVIQTYQKELNRRKKSPGSNRDEMEEE